MMIGSSRFLHFTFFGLQVSTVHVPSSHASNKSAPSQATSKRSDRFGQAFEQAPPDNTRSANKDSGTGFGTYLAAGCCCLFIFAALIVGATIGTAYYGTQLALKEIPIFTAPTAPSPTPVPPSPSPPSSATGLCSSPDRLMDFRISFDSDPSTVGFSLLKGDGTLVWNFQPGSFRSSTQLSKINQFTVCLNPNDNYVFAVNSADASGLVSQVSDATVYGYWELFWNGNMIASYDGDCSGSTASSCGPYCDCQYTIASDGSSMGACNSKCFLVRS
jgi:hypothetical protein